MVTENSSSVNQLSENHLRERIPLFKFFSFILGQDFGVRGYKPAIVYNFTSQMNNIFPIMGQPNHSTSLIQFVGLNFGNSWKSNL